MILLYQYQKEEIQMLISLGQKEVGIISYPMLYLPTSVGGPQNQIVDPPCPHLPELAQPDSEFASFVEIFPLR